MRVMITGASGLLGRRVFNKFSKVEEIIGTTYSNDDNKLYRLDITDRDAVMKFVGRFEPDVVVHTAALVDVDHCETNHEEARKVNIEGTKNIVEASKENGIKLVHISSDYVFSGESPPYKESDTLNPVNFYGETKAEAERVVEGLEGSLIIRPTVLEGDDTFSKKNSFSTKIIETLSLGRVISLDDNIVKYPLLTDDVGNAIKLLLDRNTEGTYHIRGSVAATRYEWARQIARSMDLPESLINRNGSPGRAERPLNVNLDDSKLRALGFEYTGVNLPGSLRIINNQRGCTFRMIYSTRPDMLILGQSASDFRIRLGKQLARERPVDANVVVPIPESGNFGAMGYSEQSGIPFYSAVIRDYVQKPTLEYVDQSLRIKSLEKKLIVVPELIKGRDVILMDEAIVTGSTMKVIVDKLRGAGVNRVHGRIFSPPMISNCTNGILPPDSGLAARMGANDQEEVERELSRKYNLDSLGFISYGGFVDNLGRPRESCTECFALRGEKYV